MNLSRIVAILLAITCVGLGAVTLNLMQQNRELNAQLTSLDAARQAAAHGEWFPDSGERRGGLRQALEAELAANAELRKELAQLKGAPAATPEPAPTLADEPAPRENRGGGGRGENWLDRLRQQDPQRYQQIIAERDQRRQEMQEWYETTLANLRTRARAPQVPEEAALATQLADTLTKLNDLRSQIAAARQLPEAERQQQMSLLMPEMQATWQQLTALREQDRQLQYMILGKQLGLNDTKAQELAASIPTIDQNTRYLPRGWGGGGPPSGR